MPRAWVSPLKTVDFFLAPVLVISVCPLWSHQYPNFWLAYFPYFILCSLCGKDSSTHALSCPRDVFISLFLLQHTQQGFLPFCYPADRHPGHETVIFVVIVLTRKWYSGYLSKTKTHCRRWEIRLTKAKAPATTILNSRLYDSCIPISSKGLPR